MKNKKRGGFTLVELLLAITVLALVAAPMFGAFLQALKMNVQGYKLTMATFIAQQKVEEFVGLTEEDIKGRLGSLPTTEKDLLIDQQGFNATVEFDTTDSNNLREIIIRVYDGEYTTSATDDVLLYTQRDYLNIAENGYTAPGT